MVLPPLLEPELPVPPLLEPELPVPPLLEPELPLLSPEGIELSLFVPLSPDVPLVSSPLQPAAVDAAKAPPTRAAPRLNRTHFFFCIAISLK
jgi:hypothetical protein